MYTNHVYCSCLLLVRLNNEINQTGYHGINSVPQISLIINGGKIKRYLASNEGILLTESPNYLLINAYKIISIKVKLFLLLHSPTICRSTERGLYGIQWSRSGGYLSSALIICFFFSFQASGGNWLNECHHMGILFLIASAISVIFQGD